MDSNIPNEATQLALSCRHCQAGLRIGDRFCSHCGKPTEASPPPSIEEGETLQLDIGPIVPPAPGDLFAERFVIQEELGSGGMGVVFLVEDQATQARLALKILRPELLLDHGARSRFEREIRILARIRHPSIPKVIEWGIHESSMFFVTEFLEGENLEVFLKRRGTLPVAEAVPLLTAVAEALGSAHQVGVIHRDIKPGNIMLSPSGSVHLIDFGVARTASAEMTRLTATGLFIGTPNYMAPEQLDSRRADERSDIYSLGVVLFELLTGKLPFGGDTPMAIASKHLHENPPSPRLVEPSIPFWLERIVLRCLEKDPTARFWTVNELLTELRKSHAKARIRRRTLPNGDVVVEDPGRRNGWELMITSDHEKIGWGPSMALYYKDSFYRNRSITPPSGEDPCWGYAFDLWPEGEVMRRVVDYEAEATIQEAPASLLSKAKKFFGSGS